MLIGQSNAGNGKSRELASRMLLASPKRMGVPVEFVYNAIKPVDQSRNSIKTARLEGHNIISPRSGDPQC